MKIQENGTHFEGIWQYFLGEVKVSTENMGNFLLTIFNVVLSAAICLFGMTSNIINIIIFNKLGVNDSSNLSFLTLALSDLCSLTSGVVFDLCSSLSNFTPADQFVLNPMTAAYLTTVFPRLLFSRFACCITVYVAIERCLCIGFPLKVKHILTPKRTLLILATLFSGCAAAVCFPVFVDGFRLTFEIDPVSNRSTLGLTLDPKYKEKSATVSSLNASFFAILFAIVISSMSVLTTELNRMSKWRSSITQDSMSRLSGLSKRDQTLGRIVIVLYLFMIATYLPLAVFSLLDAANKDFAMFEHYDELSKLMIEMSYIFKNINSSSSIFIYYKMSSQYKRTFNRFFIQSRA